MTRVRMPIVGDTIRLGEPFLFLADFDGEGDVSEVGVQLTWEPFDPDERTEILRKGRGPYRTLFRRALGEGEGIYTWERWVRIDALASGASVDSLRAEGQFYLGAYGEVWYPVYGTTG